MVVDRLWLTLNSHFPYAPRVQSNVRRKPVFSLFFFSFSFSVSLARIFRSIQSRMNARPNAFDTRLSVPIYLRARERVEPGHPPIAKCRNLKKHSS